MNPRLPAFAVILVIGTFIAASFGFGFIAFCSGQKIQMPDMLPASADTSAYPQIYFSSSPGDSAYVPSLTVKKRRAEKSQGINAIDSGAATSGLRIESVDGDGEILLSAASHAFRIPEGITGVWENGYLPGYQAGITGAVNSVPVNEAAEGKNAIAQTNGETTLLRKIASSIGSAVSLVGLSFVLLIAIAVPYGKLDFSLRIKKDLHRLFSHPLHHQDTVPGSIDSLALAPEPVRRYFAFAAPHGLPPVPLAVVAYTGKYRLHESVPWIPMRGEEYIRADLPALTWHAHLTKGTFGWVEAMERYLEGKGDRLFRLFSAFRIFDHSVFRTSETSVARINCSSLARLLGDGVWHPASLIPSKHLTWEPADGNSARAVLRDSGLQVSAVFTFDESGRIIRAVTEDRLRSANGEIVPVRHTHHYLDWQEIGDIKVPGIMEYVWNLPEGDFPYAWFSLTSLSFSIPTEFSSTVNRESAKDSFVSRLNSPDSMQKECV
ncbi:MAG: DUF6544 family protein [Methanoregulaceae archaeon]